LVITSTLKCHEQLNHKQITTHLFVPKLLSNNTNVFLWNELLTRPIDKKMKMHNVWGQIS